MVARNEHTGDLIQTRGLSEQGKSNYDLIFRKNKVAEPAAAPDKPMEPVPLELWTDEEERRMDIIGANSNEGLHYGELQRGFYLTIILDRHLLINSVFSDHHTRVYSSRVVALSMHPYSCFSA